MRTGFSAVAKDTNVIIVKLMIKPGSSGIKENPKCGQIIPIRPPVSMPAKAPSLVT